MESTKSRVRRANNGCVSIKVSTRRSDRVPRPTELVNEYRVDEHGALMIASAATCLLTHGEWTPESERNELVVGRHENLEGPIQVRVVAATSRDRSVLIGRSRGPRVFPFARDCVCLELRRRVLKSHVLVPRPCAQHCSSLRGALTFPSLRTLPPLPVARPP